MERNNKDIGQAIREKLESLDRSPHNELWQAIEADLPKKRKRRILPFWLMLASIAVIALLLYVATDGFGLDGNTVRQDTEINRNGENQGDQNGTAGIDGIIDNPRANGNDNAGSATSAGNGLREGKTGHSHDMKSKNDFENGIPRSGNRKSAGKRASEKAGSKSKKPGYASAESKSGLKSAGRKNRRNRNEDSTTMPENLANSASHADGPEKQATQEAGQENPILNGNTISGTKTGSPGNDEKAQTGTAVTDSIAKAIADKEKKNKIKDKDTTRTEEIEAANYKTFSVFLYGAPTYYNTFSKISSIDTRLDSLSRRAEITYNYGGYLGFKYDDKWSVRIGIARTDFKHTTTGIPVSSLSEQNYYNLEYADGVTNETVAGQFAEAGRFNLIQEISYLEFPIELKYKLLDKKISIEGIGGVSTLFLKDNTVTAESGNSGSVIMGSTRNLYKAYFSANLGVGFSYGITDNLKFNIEPIFKYHLRTGSVAWQPYSIAVLGGLEYTFNWNTNKKTRAKGERSKAKK